MSRRGSIRKGACRRPPGSGWGWKLTGRTSREGSNGSTVGECIGRCRRRGRMSRIAQLSLGYVNYEAGRTEVRWGVHRFRHAALLARVRTDDGATGLGVAWANLDEESKYAEASRAAVAAWAVGADALAPFETGRLCQQAAYNGGVARAGSVVEMALWDLAGQLLGVPVYQLLGCKRRSLPAYVISAEEFAFHSVAQ